MSLHKEINFEKELCDHLAAHGWLYEATDAANYDRARALFPTDVLAWVQATQPQAWEVLAKNHGAQAGETLLARLRDQIDQRGTLDVLRHGIELLGLNKPLLMAQFKPALAINPDILVRYAANRLRVVRQVRYSLTNENCLDLVLFLNGLPVTTAELKTDFTQSIGDAIDQYRFDRLPRPKGLPAEPLLCFPSGALVHFAVSNSEVAMVTKLDGPPTRFLPFNQGNDGGAGNPVNQSGGQPWASPPVCQAKSFHNEERGRGERTAVPACLRSWLPLNPRLLKGKGNRPAGGRLLHQLGELGGDGVCLNLISLGRQVQQIRHDPLGEGAVGLEKLRAEVDPTVRRLQRGSLYYHPM